MRIQYNIYCDESCHLLNDNSDIMVLGALWIPHNKKDHVFSRIKEIKQRHFNTSRIEIKWNKLSKSKEQFYMDILDYFYDDDDLHFRALIIDKTKLDHEKYEQTHDSFYYKMYFTMLKIILNPQDSYKVYLDIKDTQGQQKVDDLCSYLRSTHYDYERKIVKVVQQVESKHVQALQITDLLTGAICYLNRNLNGNPAKLRFIKRMQERSGYTLTKSTLYREDKTNIFIWKSQSEI